MPRDKLIQKRRGTAAAWTSANPVLAVGEEGFETDTRKSKVGDGSTAWTGLSYTAAGGGGPPTGSAGGTLGGTYPNPTVNTDGSTLETSSSALRVKALGITDSHVATANKDGTTSTPSLRTLGTGAAQAAAGNDSRLSDSRAPNGSAGGVLDGSYPNPGLAAGVAGAGLAETSDVLSVNVDGSTIEINADTLRVKAGGIGANELASTAVTPTTYGDSTHVGSFTVDADGRITAASAVAISGAGGGAGASSLVYRYTVAGTDKTSIDTGVDTAGAGSTDWTNGDLLEVLIVHRTDDASVAGSIFVTVNNDTGSNYDYQVFSGANATVAAAGVNPTTAWGFGGHGASGTASRAATLKLEIPGYAGTTFHKAGNFQNGRTDSTAANMAAVNGAMAWASTSAITRLKVTPQTGGSKLKVGTVLLIYKRLAS